METLKIEIPKGYVIDSFDQNTGEIKFKEKPKHITERIKTMEDVMNYLGIDPYYFEESCEGLKPDEAAYRQLKLLAKALNDGWEPDWNNKNQYKYFPWFEMGGSFGFRSYGHVNSSSFSAGGSCLCFKSRELAEYAGKQFTEVYKQFMTL